MEESRYRFDPAAHAAELTAIFAAAPDVEHLTGRRLDRLLRGHPRRGRGFFSRSELVRGLRWLAAESHPAVAHLDPAAAAERLRHKPVRTLSGVAAVTVFTRPHPCPGRCVFCPSDVRMPKSYLASEPGCQRAETHGFDPYRQTWARLRALADTGHRVDKVELIVLGGTWSSYPEGYRVAFVRRCLEALNRFRPGAPPPADPGDSGGPAAAPRPRPAASAAGEAGGSYNRRVAAAGWTAVGAGDGDEASAGADAWQALAAAQRANETAASRCVGLSLETRPDRLDAAGAVHLRRLGATRLQLGYQSLSDRVLALNRRGHGSAETRRAMQLARGAGFKVHAHWMANLLGSDPAADLADYRRLFADPAYRPDELKLYPCSLVESSELMDHWRAGRWRPYGEDELRELVARCLAATPLWCRLTRVVRDIPGHDIVAGSRVTNLRQVAERQLARRGVACRDIRAREVRGEAVDPRTLRLGELGYRTSTGREAFLQATTPHGRLAGFLRLALPATAPPAELAELAGAAVIREVHVYGAVAGLGEPAGGRAQHAGLGTRLVERAAALARAAGYRRLAVISSVGTRGWYRRLGFADGELYQHRSL